MFQFYFCISIVVFIALSIGLVSGIYFRPPEIYTDREIYQLAGIITTALIILAYVIIYILNKKKIMTIEDIKGLAKNKKGGNHEKI